MTAFAQACRSLVGPRGRHRRARDQRHPDGGRADGDAWLPEGASSAARRRRVVPRGSVASVRAARAVRVHLRAGGQLSVRWVPACWRSRSYPRWRLPSLPRRPRGSIQSKQFGESDATPERRPFDDPGAGVSRVVSVHQRERWPLALHHRILHVKFAASSGVPAPEYAGTRGYGHAGRVRSTLPSLR
jgi:hypothetical protein